MSANTLDITKYTLLTIPKITIQSTVCYTKERIIIIIINYYHHRNYYNQYKSAQQVIKSASANDTT